MQKLKTPSNLPWSLLNLLLFSTPILSFTSLHDVEHNCQSAWISDESFASLWHAFIGIKQKMKKTLGEILIFRKETKFIYMQLVH